MTKIDEVPAVTRPTEPFDPFFNANTPDDIATGSRLRHAPE
jgi:hypothetical protein